jgi:hypothetical protein
MASESGYRDSLVRVFAQHQCRCASTLHQQVADRLVVDLQVRQCDLGDFSFLYVLDLLEKLLHSHEDDTGLL